MTIEETALEDRVARFAALADPVRLRIVDLLTLSDAAPVELQSELGISSSLLAHHLRVLETAGFVKRSRSEADRRRSYLRLIPAGFDKLAPPPGLAANRVVFVCTGNSARSQLAAALWQQSSDVPVTSAGTHPAATIDAGALDTAARHGLRIQSAAPRSIQDTLDADDFIITVCDAAHEELGTTGQLHWSIPDPVPEGTQAAFEHTFQNITTRIQGLSPHLMRQ